MKDTLLKKLFLRNIIRKKFLNFLKKNRYRHEDHEITYIKINKNHNLPNKFLLNLVNITYQIIENDFKNIKANSFFSYNEISNLSNHYILLKAISEALNAKQIVEIGTASGMSLASFLQSKYTSKVYTWDLYPISHPDSAHWYENIDTKNFVDNFLNENSERFSQFVEDINNPEIFKKRKSILENADIIFIDGPHNGIFEQELFNKIMTISLKRNSILILDDIKVSSMVSFWDQIVLPKLDISHIGHITGTGIVKLN